LINFKKNIFILLGWSFVILGIVGAILPLMPSTVFFIIAAWFFARSSPNFHNKLLTNKYVGKHIKNFYEKNGMPLKSKVISIAMIFLTISFSLFMIERTPFLIVILLSVAFAVSFYILSLNTIQDVDLDT